MAPTIEPLHNYIHTFRKKADLTQADMAALLGFSPPTFRRHESGIGLPDLETALAYEAIFNIPIRELYAGIDAAVRLTVCKHARQLRQKLEGMMNVPAVRVAAVKALAEMPWSDAS